MHLIIAVGTASVIATALRISSGEVRGAEQAIGYSHGETDCLQGNEGPDIRLRFGQHNRCEANVSYPYLEIDIREFPVALRKSITIGADNWGL